MKPTLLTLILFVVSLSVISLISNVRAQNTLPPFNVHVAPNGNCGGSQPGAYVRIEFDYQGQTILESTTNGEGWAYFTAPIGDVYVYSSYGGHAYGCWHTQPVGGSQHYICLNDTFCYLKDKDMAFGNRFGVYLFLYD